MTLLFCLRSSSFVSFLSYPFSFLFLLLLTIDTPGLASFSIFLSTVLYYS